MGITHVIRGDDHITNTPKQILIYQALGVPVPTFAHVPLILGPDKRRLSKRHGATSVVEYSERGIMAEAMRNFLALLGWSPGDDREIMELDELVKAFSLEGINASGAVFDETKLEWMNQQYIMHFSDAEVWEGMRPFLQEFCRNEGVAEPTEELGLKLAALFKERLRSFGEAVDKMAYFLRDPVTYDEKGMRKHWKPETGAQVERLLTELSESKSWNREVLEACIDGVSEEFGIKRAALIHPVRLALTGGISSPGIFDVMEILGRDTCLKRIDSALARWTTGASD
jgi:glutamyl-tRNA synthetase